MKTLGLIGGMSWQSTIPYYTGINSIVGERLGALHSARLILYSVDFHAIELLQRRGAWNEAGQELARIARRLEAAGAEGLVLCTNTMHKVADHIESAVNIPLLHIVDVTAAEVKRRRLKTVGLLGTSYTMEDPFYRQRMRVNHGVEAIVPDGDDRREVSRIIYEELCLGKVMPSSRLLFENVIGKFVAAGAEAVILGCTEISMLIDPRSSQWVILDSMALHVAAAADFALGG